LLSKWSDKWTSEPEEYTPLVKSLANIFVRQKKRLPDGLLSLRPHHCGRCRAAHSANNLVQL
jgi:hypothetical protein